MGKTSRDKRDIYYRIAKEQGWRARSAFKLLQIQESFDIFRDVKRVVDLCAAPGSWSQVLSKQVYLAHQDDLEVKIVAVDLQTMAPLEGVVQLKGDITDPVTANLVISQFGGQLADFIICDGAPDVIGLVDIDEYVQHQLVLAALEITIRILKPGGTMVAKVFRGGKISILTCQLSQFFDRVTVAKKSLRTEGRGRDFTFISEIRRNRPEQLWQSLLLSPRSRCEQQPKCLEIFLNFWLASQMFVSLFELQKPVRDDKVEIVKNEGFLWGAALLGKRSGTFRLLQKPKCSRDSSLEAFAVCQGYRSPPDFTDNLRSFLARTTADLLRNVDDLPVAPFLVCGQPDAFDSDRTYPLQLDHLPEYQYREPVQAPIHPPYEAAQKMRKEKTLATVEQTHHT